MRFWQPCAALVLWMNKSSYEQELKNRGELIYTTTGMSMRPFLRSGEDLMVIRSAEGVHLRLRDVILYRRDNGRYVLHRIMWAGKDSYVLCGDNCWQLEPGIRRDQVLGVLTDVIRSGKKCSVSAPAYRLAVMAWWVGYPVRAAVLFGRYCLGVLWKRIKGVKS